MKTDWERVMKEVDAVQKMYEEEYKKEQDEQEAPSGWICPRCGRGVAPWVSYCNCNLSKNLTFYY